MINRRNAQRRKIIKGTNEDGPRTGDDGRSTAESAEGTGTTREKRVTDDYRKVRVGDG